MIRVTHVHVDNLGTHLQTLRERGGEIVAVTPERLLLDLGVHHDGQHARVTFYLVVSSEK